ncbi:Uncharacterised protein r2_g3200 [Pycnogonum litorale]
MSKLPLPRRLNLQSHNLREEWKRFISSFELYLTAIEADAKADRIKIAKLLTVGGEELQDLYNTFVFAIPRAEDGSSPSGPNPSYAAVIAKLEEHCSPKANETCERFVFRNRFLKDGESIEAFLTDLKKLSQSCNFSPLTD